MQYNVNKYYDDHGSLTIDRQHKTEHFARLARAVKRPRFNPNLHYSLRPENSAWKLLFWDNYRQEFVSSEQASPLAATCCPAQSYNS